MCRILESAGSHTPGPRDVNQDNAAQNSPARRCVGAVVSPTAALYSTWETDTERIDRTLQWRVSRRMSQRALISNAARDPTGDRSVAVGILQRGTTTRGHQRHAPNYPDPGLDRVRVRFVVCGVINGGGSEDQREKFSAFPWMCLLDLRTYACPCTN